MAKTLTFSPISGGSDILYYSTSSGTTGWTIANGAASAIGTFGSLISYDFSLSSTSYISRYFIPFNTSSIPQGSKIISAFVRLVANGTANENGSTETIDIVSSTQTSTSSLVNGDYSKIGTTVFGSLLVSGYTSTNLTNNDISLNATGLAAITIAGTTKFGIRFDKDRTATPPGDGKSNRVFFTPASTILSVTFEPPSGFFFFMT